MADGGFSPENPGNPALGPGSNTGQKVSALVDYLTVVLPRSKAKGAGLARLDCLLETIFGFRGRVTPTMWREKRWQFYRYSSVFVDREGELVGRAGCDGEDGTICISCGTPLVDCRAAYSLLLARDRR